MARFAADWGGSLPSSEQPELGPQARLERLFGGILSGLGFVCVATLAQRRACDGFGGFPTSVDCSLGGWEVLAIFSTGRTVCIRKTNYIFSVGKSLSEIVLRKSVGKLYVGTLSSEIVAT